MFNKISEERGFPKLGLATELSVEVQKVVDNFMEAIQTDEKKAIDILENSNIKNIVVVGDIIELKFLYNMIHRVLHEAQDKRKGKAYIKDFYTEKGERVVLILKIYE